jgi:hypothetical protein
MIALDTEGACQTICTLFYGKFAFAFGFGLTFLPFPIPVPDFGVKFHII